MYARASVLEDWLRYLLTQDQGVLARVSKMKYDRGLIIADERANTESSYDNATMKTTVDRLCPNVTSEQK
jgi:hypothetical protein